MKSDDFRWEQDARQHDAQLSLGKRVHAELDEVERTALLHNGEVDQHVVNDHYEHLPADHLAALSYYSDYLQDNPSETPLTIRAGTAQPARPQITSVASAGVESSSLTLTDVANRWIKYKMTVGKGWAKSSLARNKPVLEKFVILLGNSQAHTVSKAILRDRFIEGRYRLPKGLKKHHELHLTDLPEISPEDYIIDVSAFKSIDEILEITQEKGWAIDKPDTIGRENGTIKSFLKWASSQDYMQDGLVGVLDDYTQYSRDTNRVPFVQEELKRFFEGDHYRNGLLLSEPHKFWAPLIALTTGARVGEIAQLRCDDIYLVDVDPKAGVSSEFWCFKFIADVDTQQTIKSGSKRAVPIPEVLIGLGLLNYWRSVQGRGEDQLFPVLRPSDKGNWGGEISDWFHGGKRQKGFMQQCGVEKSIKIDGEWKKRVFHGFRHTWNYLAKNSGVNKEMRKEVSGHAQGEVKDTNDLYSHDYLLFLRKQAIEQVEFGVDWSAVRGWCSSLDK